MKKRIKVAIIYGTRPEGIKLAPIIKGLQKGINKKLFKTRIIFTGQHKDLANQVNKLFKIKPDYDLAVMKKDQSLSELTSIIMKKLDLILEKEKPDVVLVQGDTTSAFCGALSAFYHKIKIGHVEAGLRTKDKYSPFPEEINRRLVSSLADFNFVPTKTNSTNLEKEGVTLKQIFLTGNTVIDALFEIVKKKVGLPPELKPTLDKKIILVTAHRRENFGQKHRNLFLVLKKIAEEFNDVSIVYPVHLNPNVLKTAKKMLRGVNNIFLIDPLEYAVFSNLMKESYFIITDSGGIQEEAPSLGKPVLVVRDKTERPEGIEAGCSLLVGTRKDKIYREMKKLLLSRKYYEKMSQAKNPYGNGSAAKNIISVLRKKL